MLTFDRQQMLKLINQTPALSAMYLQIMQDTPRTEKAMNEVLRRLFDEQVADGPYYDKWPNAKVEYPDIPKHDTLTAELQRLMNLHGWKRLLRGFARYATIKDAELRNGGFFGAADKWLKFKETAITLSNQDLIN